MPYFECEVPRCEHAYADPREGVAAGRLAIHMQKDHTAEERKGLCPTCHKPLPCPWDGVHPEPWGGACPYGAI